VYKRRKFSDEFKREAVDLAHQLEPVACNIGVGTVASRACARSKNFHCARVIFRAICFNAGRSVRPHFAGAIDNAVTKLSSDHHHFVVAIGSTRRRLFLAVNPGFPVLVPPLLLCHAWPLSSHPGEELSISRTEHVSLRTCRNRITGSLTGVLLHMAAMEDDDTRNGAYAGATGRAV
jgi:hypothetical protein